DAPEGPKPQLSFPILVDRRNRGYRQAVLRREVGHGFAIVPPDTRVERADPDVPVLVLRDRVRVAPRAADADELSLEPRAFADVVVVADIPQLLAVRAKEPHAAVAHPRVPARVLKNRAHRRLVQVHLPQPREHLPVPAADAPGLCPEPD